MIDALRWFVPLAGCAIFGPALLALAGFLYLTQPPRYVGRETPATRGWDYEELTLETSDGVRLHAWFIPAALQTAGADGSALPEGHPQGMAAANPATPDESGRTRPAIIMVHGYPFDKSDLLGVADDLHDTYDLLLFDLRSFGQSEGARTSLGHHERHDMIAATAYLQQRGIDRIGVWGFSLGGAVTLLTLPEAPSLRAAVVDSPFADLRTMALDYYHLPVVNHVLVFYTDLLSRLVFGTPLADVSPARAAAQADRPLLLIHGDQDTTIPPHHFEQLRSALADNGAAEFWLVAGSGHTQSHSSQPDLYRARLRAFFAQHLGPSL